MTDVTVVTFLDENSLLLYGTSYCCNGIVATTTIATIDAKSE
jgi:hypothetical protein